MRGLTCKGCSGSRPSPYPKASSKSCYNLDVRGATNKNVIVHMPTQIIPPFRMASSYFTVSFSFKHTISLDEHRRLFQVQWSTCFSTLFWIFFLMVGGQQGNLASLETWNQYANVMAKPPHMKQKLWSNGIIFPKRSGERNNIFETTTDFMYLCCWVGKIVWLPSQPYITVFSLVSQKRKFNCTGSSIYKLPVNLGEK